MQIDRVKIIFFAGLFLSLLLFFRLYILQIRKGNYYSALALGQYVSVESDINKRGEVFFSQQTSAVIAYPGRVYVNNDLASHILGFVNKDNKGQYGVEGFYNNLLTGKDGLNIKIKSPFGYLASFFDFKQEAVIDRGCDLYLTINYNLQYFSEKLLQKAYDDWQIEKGQIIIMDPKSGAILAMAVFPSFNPNAYSQENDLSIFTNPALQVVYEPGSIMKPITMAAGIEEGVISPKTTYTDMGFVEVGGPAIRNYDKNVFGLVDMEKVLEKSINTGAVFVEQRLGKKKFLDYLKKFAFFEKTEIDLQGEVSSTNTTLLRGYPRDLSTASFGQGIEITPIQMLKAFSALSNNGYMVKPYIVEKIVDSSGKELLTEPQKQGPVISEKTAQDLTAMLVNVIDNSLSQKAVVKGYAIAGKTGTAQIPLRSGGYEETGTIHNFIGYFPAYNPQFLILIKVDRPKGVKTASGSVAGTFGELAKYIIDLYQIPPEVSLASGE